MTEPPPINILLVDDRPENRFAMAELLAQPGYCIVQAESGREALKCLLDTEFAVILLDVQMPGMDGFETARCIRERERSRHTPIIFVTAVGKDSESVEKGYAFGAVDYLFKPVTPLVLKAKVSVFAELHRKQVQDTMIREYRQAVHELARSNTELEQFAYIASHDLQEPLRKIKSFTELLARQYKGHLDEKADTYIFYITDGADRMQRLINGLLSYSRITTQAGPMDSIDFNALVEQVRDNIALKLEETGTVLSVGHLPTLRADPAQMERLFQNLVLNAIKFRGTAIPEILIRAEQDHSGGWQFLVRDNGMGMDPGQCERIFNLFQRLNSRADYPGDGMGLAICKKIIDRHGGRIWAESNGPGTGTAIRFILPESMHEKKEAL